MSFKMGRLTRLIFHVRSRVISVGQINQDNEVGRWIKLISSLENVKSIVEVGTWNGKGSSQCIAEGVLDRRTPNCHVIGFEVNPAMFKKAQKNLSKFDFFEIVFGSVVTGAELDQSNLSDEESEWFNQDFRWIRDAPLVSNKVPEAIDLLILDGGEFSTYAEFKLFEKKLTGWLVLDDTRTRKCSRILEELKLDSNYLIVHTSQERNGTAVLLKLASCFDNFPVL
jgi:hypothetical protein